MLKVHGAPLSPFVRKVLLTLEFKGLDYELEPVFPGNNDPSFRAMSPLGKIPALEHDGFTTPDSSVICRYLEKVFPEKPLYPTDPQLEARASWIEEYCDTKLMDACGGLFFQRFMAPKIMKQPTDEAAVNNILTNLMPAALDYMESITPEGAPMVADSITIADIAVTTCFLQAQYGDFEVDGATHPKLRAYLDRALTDDVVTVRLEAEKQMLAGLGA